MVSVVIPTYNEAETIAPTLEHLRRARGNFEVLVVGGESDDGTGARVAAMIPGFPRPLRLLKARRNRALQLNHAAEAPPHLLARWYQPVRSKSETWKSPGSRGRRAAGAKADFRRCS